jgi:hypothetical protein
MKLAASTVGLCFLSITVYIMETLQALQVFFVLWESPVISGVPARKAQGNVCTVVNPLLRSVTFERNSLPECRAIQEAKPAVKRG